MVLYGFNEIMTDPDQRHFNETLINLSRSLDTHYAYGDDLTATPWNSWARWEKSRFARSIADGCHQEILGALMDQEAPWWALSNSWVMIRSSPQFLSNSCSSWVEDIQDSLDNIAISFSKAAGLNYTSYFDKALKFNLSTEAKLELESLPLPPNQLLNDKDRLWFGEEEQVIPILGRTVQYLSDGALYSLYAFEDALIGSSSDGGTNPSRISGQRYGTFTLVAEDASGTEIGRHDYLIKRRQGVPVLDYMENAYAYYTANKVTRVSLVGEDAISFEKLGDPSVANHGLLWIDWPFLNHREYRLRGEYTYESVGELSHFGFGFDSPAGGHGESKAYFELNDDFYVRDQLHPFALFFR